MPELFAPLHGRAVKRAAGLLDSIAEFERGDITSEEDVRAADPRVLT
jgi:hypothetical protein